MLRSPAFRKCCPFCCHFLGDYMHKTISPTSSQRSRASNHTNWLGCGRTTLTGITGDAIFSAWISCKIPMYSSLPCGARREPAPRCWIALWRFWIRPIWGQRFWRNTRKLSNGVPYGWTFPCLWQSAKLCWMIFARQLSGSRFISDGGRICPTLAMTMSWSWPLLAERSTSSLIISGISSVVISLLAGHAL